MFWDGLTTTLLMVVFSGGACLAMLPRVPGTSLSYTGLCEPVNSLRVPGWAQLYPSA